jgi:hypothetical protein
MLSVIFNCDISFTVKLMNRKICTAVYAAYAMLLWMLNSYGAYFDNI